jgi:hypothetical protein
MGLLLIIGVMGFSISAVAGTCYMAKRRYKLATAWYIGTLFWFASIIPYFLSITYLW